MRKKQPYLINPVNPPSDVFYGSRITTLWRDPDGRFGKKSEHLDEIKRYTHSPRHIDFVNRMGLLEKVKKTRKSKKRSKKIIKGRKNPIGELMLINPKRRYTMRKRIKRHIPHWRKGRVFNRNPFISKGEVLPFLKDSAMMFAGFAGGNYLFGMIGNKVPMLANPPIKALAKLGLAIVLQKKLKPVAYGLALSGMRDAVATLSPQLAGQLSSFEQYLPEPDDMAELASTNTMADFLPEAETINATDEIKEEF